MNSNQQFETDEQALEAILRWYMERSAEFRKRAGPRLFAKAIEFFERAHGAFSLESF